MSNFELSSNFKPTGDQPRAIEKLTANLCAGVKHQTLLGVTGSGKTFTMANVIERMQKPALVISHNKTLAGQLYQEFKEFFPKNSVHYFVSYYDYYQPEAYIPRTDTYIEKDAKINDAIDALRHAATASLLTRDDVIIVASVSCIYGIGDPEEYEKIALDLSIGKKIARRDLLHYLVLLQYAKNEFDPRQGHFRARGDTIEIYLPSGEEIINVELENNIVVSLKKRRQQTHVHDSGFQALSSAKIFPAKHFVTPRQKLELAMKNIRQELKGRLSALKKNGRPLEAERLEQRTRFDLEMLKETGYTNGIENYSRHLSFREPGSPPPTLIDYYRHRFGDQFLVFIDESHASIPQLRGMYHGDYARKQTLVDYGFRLPSAIDNRPLKFPEFEKKINQRVYISATPAEYELHMSRNSESKPATIVEQLIRPTGVLDPKTEVRPTKGQVKDVIAEVKKRIAKRERSLVLSLTKRLAEDIAEYLQEAGIKAEYLHSEIKTLERSDILKNLRTGKHDVIVGINLLREGLDLPEVSFIAILDADKEGFLRNETTLLQIIGRAARHIDGKVILYADTITESMRRAIGETGRRRKIQEKYNKKHGVTPKKIEKAIRKSLLEEITPQKDDGLPAHLNAPSREVLAALEREMKKAAREMNFELAAKIRDRIKTYRKSR